MPDPAPPAKLYVVVDAALSPGQQLAQAVHAAFQLSYRFPSATARWFADSNYLVVLSSPDPEAHARQLVNWAKCVVVHEPDLPDNPVTAVAFLPHPSVGRALSSLPLALKQVAMA